MDNTKQCDQQRRRRAGLLTGALAALATAALALCALTPSAEASFEQLPTPDGVFSGTTAHLTEAELEADEEIQLGSVSAMAVNRTGAGGVPKGTVYAVTRNKEAEEDVSVNGTHVNMYEPTAGGGLKFVENWLVTKFDTPPYPGVEQPYVCGPETQTLPDGSKPGEHKACVARVSGEGASNVGVGIDQATGSVYVYGGFQKETKIDQGGTPSDFAFVPFSQVVVYDAAGGSVVTRIGEAADTPSIATSPEKTHYDTVPGNMLAVNASGEVYVYDEQALDGFYQRLMVYGPHNGNLTNYEYLGEVAGTGETSPYREYKPRVPAFDDAGHLFVAGIAEDGAPQIEELADEVPAPYPELRSPPTCRYEFSRGGLRAMTVDPATGDPFFFSEKGEKGIRYVRRLGACDEASGQFALPDAGEPELITLSPHRGDVYALTFDPDREVGEGRANGVLYAGVPESNYEASEPQGSLGYIFAHPRELAPKVESESASQVGIEAAVVEASLNPNGFQTSYVFQFLTEAEYQAAGESFAGAMEAPIGGGSIQAAGGTQTVTAALGGLAPDTTYYARVLAESACKGEDEPPCETSGGRIAFHTYPAGGSSLPDGRVWELVSPAQKNGGQVVPADPRNGCIEGVACKPGAAFAGLLTTFSAPGGEAFSYEGTNFGLGGPANWAEYVARRAATGWQTVNVTPSLLAGTGSYSGSGVEPGGGVIEQPAGAAALSPSAPPGFAELYLQSGTNPDALVPLTGTPPNRGPQEFAVHYAAASSDGSRIFFAANDALTGASLAAPAAQDGGAAKFNLYEWHEGQLSLVNVMPGNSETEPGASFATAGANTVSADGSRVFFSDAAGQVYVRIDGTETRQIPDTGSFLSAATDGSRVLLANGLLYDLENETTTDLTEGQGGFQGIAGQSNDLTHVYFVDTEVLDETPNQEGEVAVEGKDNLYSWSREGGHAQFVAMLASRDSGAEPASVNDWVAVPAQRTAEASIGGRYLAFMTKSEIKHGYDNVGLCESNSKKGFVAGPCVEVYLYDSQAHRLTCTSCTPSGTVPLGQSVLRRLDTQGESFPSQPQPRYLTNDGRLFFDSKNSLSPLDTNEGAEDVYEYEPGGIGSCGRESGCVSLISSGREAADSNFAGADESGKNVFFTTNDRLIGADTDEGFDLYDAREGGGFEAESVLPPRPCAGAACQAEAGQSIFATPASVSFVGPGNIVPSTLPAPAPAPHKAAAKAKKVAKCPRGKVRKHGRCVKRKRRPSGHSSHVRVGLNRGGAK